MNNSITTMTVLALLLTLLPVKAQENSGFILGEQRKEGIGYTGGLYSSGGLLVQFQYIGLPKNWLLGGYAWSLGKWSCELNGGLVVKKNTAEITNLCVQFNATLGNDSTRWNLLLSNEFDPGLKNNKDILWAFHHYLFRIAQKFYGGLSVEVNFEGDQIDLIPAPTFKYWIKPNLNLILAIRANLSGPRLKKASWDNVYIAVFKSFNF
jgi:hypothetical protein